jgi:hypothetical protein
MSVSKEIFAMARVRDNAPPGNLVIEGADGAGAALIDAEIAIANGPLAKPAERDARRLGSREPVSNRNSPEFLNSPCP